MFGIRTLDNDVKLITGNIMNMIVFDKFKTGNPFIDTLITTIMLSIFTYIFHFLHNNFVRLVNCINLFELNIFLKKKYVVEYDGKISLSTTYYESELNQSHSFSDRFRALWIYIIENADENNTISHIKEYSFGNVSYNKNRDLGIYMVVQNKQFIISKQHEIYACTTIQTQDHEVDKNSKERNSKRINQIEKVTIQLFSYKSNIVTIKNFVEDITKNYLSSIENSRDNKRFIYTLIKGKYEDNKYELWDENIFSSTRKFDNIFFENKEIVMQKIDFFMNNKNWYYEKGIPYSIGIGMYGPPGTGKTSLIKSIANYTNRHIVVISLKLIKTKKQLDSIFFEDRYNADNIKNSIGFDKKIIVFEDIDCIGDVVLNREKLKNKQIHAFENNIENESTSCTTKINVGDILLETLISNENANKNNYQIPKLLLDDEPITLDDILNLWDGIRETPGRIMMISSNHYHDLDPALVRPGRIDVTLELSYVSHNILKEMYLHLFNEAIDDDTIKNIKEHFYSPAEIINIYMNENRDKERFIQRLMKNEHV